MTEGSTSPDHAVQPAAGSMAVQAIRRVATLIHPSWTAGLLGALSLLLFWPGELTSDAADQLEEARGVAVSDWHSPLLTWLWRALLQTSDPVAGMLAVQLSLFWTGAAVLAARLGRFGLPRQAWAVLAVCLFPHFLFFNHYILKDTAFYAAMLVCAACWFSATSAEPGTARRRFALAFVLTALAGLIRINGAFAAAGLAVALLLPRSRFSLWRLTLGVLVASVVLVLSARWVNTHLLRAQPSDVIQALQIHDLLGIQFHSRDETVWGPRGLTNAQVDRCYSAFHWDNLAPTGSCADLRPRVGAPGGRFFLPEAAAQRGRLWLAAIQTHPLAYVQHRLRYFNSATYFFVPALHARFNKGLRDGRKAGKAPFTEADVRLDYVKRNFLVWPATWLAVALATAPLLWPHVRESATARFGIALLTSAVTYAAAYLVIGVATDVRYFLWTQLATMLALAVAWPDLRVSWSRFPKRSWLAIWVVVVVVATGTLARWADAPFV